jgi:hypothetical protein
VGNSRGELEEKLTLRAVCKRAGWRQVVSERDIICTLQVKEDRALEDSVRTACR